MQEWVGDPANIYVTGFTVCSWAYKTCKPVMDQSWSLVWPSSSSSSYHDNGYFIITLRLSKWPCWLRTCRVLVHLLCNHLKTCQKLFLPPLYRWDDRIWKQLSNLFQEINVPQSAERKPGSKRMYVGITSSMTIWQRVKGTYVTRWDSLWGMWFCFGPQINSRITEEQANDDILRPPV